MASRINVGWLAMTFAWLIGVYAAGLRPDVVMAGFPVSLFLTLAGVTLLFAIAEANGTLGALAARVIGLARGNATLIPVFVFVLACALSSIGPGADLHGRAAGAAGDDDGRTRAGCRRC